MNTQVFDKDKRYSECERCDGDGWLFGDIDDEDDNGDQRKYTCPNCNGTSQIEIED